MRPGRSAGPRVIISAHLDTVFPRGTSLFVRRDGARLIGPGIYDNSRGLAVMRAFVDNVTLDSRPGHGTVVTMRKHISWPENAPLRLAC